MSNQKDENTLSTEYKKNFFYYRNINNIRICLRNVRLQTPIVDENDKFQMTLSINSEHYNTLINVENYLKMLLKKENCTLTSELKANDFFVTKLKVVKKIIKSDIRNADNIPVSYSEIPIEKDIDIIISLDNMWCHKNYYPLYTYKWKVDEIKF